MRHGKRFVVAVLVAATMLTTAGTRAAEEAPLARGFHAIFAEKAQRAGVDPSVLLSAPATISVYRDGAVRTYTRAFGEVLERLVPDVAAPVTAGSGPFGTPEYVAGNITHLFGTAWAGSTSDAAANCQSVSVAWSTVVPDTSVVPAPINPVPVTGLPLFSTPVPGALNPLIPETSWILPAYAWLGPTLHIKGRYTIGVHQTGTLVGSNASTAGGAPEPYPVWVPMTGFGLVTDRSVDFVGQGLFTHAEVRVDVPILNVTVCGGLGLLLFSNGAAIFDNHAVLGQQIGFPDVP